MDTGLHIRWGKLVPGREEQAIELFNEATEFWTKKLEAKRITYFEPFLYMTSDKAYETGFMIIKGPVTEIFKLMEEDDYLRLVQKAMLLVEHFQVDLLTVGEGIPLELERASKVRVELGL